jgi:CRP-like cAMP-binding protein
MTAAEPCPEPPAGEREQLIAALPLFAELPGEDVAAVAERAVLRRYDAGDVVYHEGDAGESCFIVASGVVRAVREHPSGRAISLSHFHAGEIFGVSGLFDARPRPATIEVVQASELLAIAGPDMRLLMRERPELALALSAALVARLRALGERLARQAFQSVQGRVAATLLQLVDAAGGQREDAVVLKLKQTDLAKLAGASRESASRFLASIERAGVVTQGRGCLTIHDPGALEAYVY